MNELASLIRRRRLALRLTQRAAAANAGISLATWQNLERDSSRPGSFQDLTLACVAHGLGIDHTTVLAAAGRALPDLPSPPATGEPTRDTRHVGGVAEMVAHLEELLGRLADTSHESAQLVYGLAADTAGHLIDVHARKH